MRINRPALWIGFAALLIGDANAQPTTITSLPLFDAFQAFCVTTGGLPDAVRDAVKQAGGAPHQDDPAGSKKLSILGELSKWDVSIGGHKMAVTTGLTSILEDHAATGCTITSRQNEDESIAAIVKWVGLPADSSAADSSSSMFKVRYRQDGDHRSPLMLDKPGNFDTMVQALDAVVHGRSYDLTVMGQTDRAVVMLIHILPAPPKDGSPPN